MSEDGLEEKKSCGTESLQKNQKKMWSADEKYELIAKVLAGVSITESAISAGVEPSLLSQWVRCYKMKGYQGLAAQRKGRPPKEPDMNMKKKIVPAELTPSEREELIRLRAENEYLRTENEVIKKRIALRREKFAAQLKAKKLHSSKNSEEKDTLWTICWKQSGFPDQRITMKLVKPMRSKNEMPICRLKSRISLMKTKNDMA